MIYDKTIRLFTVHYKPSVVNGKIIFVREERVRVRAYYWNCTVVHRSFVILSLNETELFKENTTIKIECQSS